MPEFTDPSLPGEADGAVPSEPARPVAAGHHAALAAVAAHHLATIRTTRAEWQAAILVCGKCAKRIGGGFGRKGRTPLAKLLRKLGNRRKGRRANLGVVETGCLKLCPKDAAVALNGAHPRDWKIIRAGTPTEDILRALDLPLD